MIQNLEKEKQNDLLIKKKINLGIEILRAYMSFSIVVLHFLKNEYQTNFFMKFIFHCKSFYVPTFFLISFYFSFNTLSSKNINRIKLRFSRILIPYVIWPIFIWTRNIIINFKYIKINKQQIRSITLQLLTGCDFYNVFWFQFDLIMITIIFTIIIFTFKNYLTVLKILGPLYFIINKYYEEYMNLYNHICSIRPLLGCSIYSLTGFFLGSRNILIKLTNTRYKSLILIIPAIILINKYKLLLNITIRFKIIVVDLVIICLFISFALLPFEFIKSNIQHSLK